MAPSAYLALLRGINVGGRNIVPMADLRDAFEEAGYGSVSTYIQSGNVLFDSDRPRASLEGELERVLEKRFGVSLPVVARSHRQLHNLVAGSPPGFGARPEEFHYDVVYLKTPLTSQRAMRVVELRDGVDWAWPGPGVLYFSRLSERRAQSRMSRLTTRAEYQQMTIRNWNTTTKLLTLLDARNRG